jgi:hypothetical protein
VAGLNSFLERANQPLPNAKTVACRYVHRKPACCSYRKLFGAIRLADSMEAGTGPAGRCNVWLLSLPRIAPISALNTVHDGNLNHDQSFTVSCCCRNPVNSSCSSCRSRSVGSYLRQVLDRPTSLRFTVVSCTVANAWFQTVIVLVLGRSRTAAHSGIAAH